MIDRLDEQLERIRQKLILARNHDSEFRTFGAASHRYILLDPVSEEIVNGFESGYQIELPNCYRAFIRRLGNAGVSYQRSGAGPYFGIFPFGENVGLLMKNPEKYLRNECNLYPDMSDHYWEELTHRIHFDEKISDQDYDDEMGKILGGVLLLGSQGCTFFHALIVTGKHAGRVVNVDMCLEKPKFASEKTFLDWYERWLNEILTGHQLQNKPIVFG